MTIAQNYFNLSWGLNLGDYDVTTQEEIDSFRRISAEYWGFQHPAFDYWLNERPDVLKRYRAWAENLRLPVSVKPRDTFNGNGLAILMYYATHGFRDGFRYALTSRNRFLSKAELLDFFALAFRYVGPRGMALIASVASDHAWQEEPESPARWPDGWAFDPEALRSGIDFADPVLTQAERVLIDDWYLRYLGEIPGHITFLADRRPELLKAYRNRFENTFRVLPKQVEPMVLIENSVERSFPDGLREGVLMARGFGVSKLDVLEAISWGTFYGTAPGLDFVERTVGDVLDAWE